MRSTFAYDECHTTTFQLINREHRSRSHNKAYTSYSDMKYNNTAQIIAYTYNTYPVTSVSIEK